MKRWAVSYESKGVTQYHAIGLGSSEDAQLAHLYTKEHLAEKQAEYYRSTPQWHGNVRIIEVEVTGL